MIIYNVKIYTMNIGRKIIENGYVEIDEDKISFVGEGRPDEIFPEDIDGKGASIYPGFIDAHTHVGLSGMGAGVENEDFNEEFEANSAQLRVTDSINAFDKSFELAAKAGITTVVVAPGSANAIGGEIAAVSTLGKRIDKMVLRTVGIKFALGENPKMTYLNRDETPCTRMATAALIREALKKTQRYVEQTNEAEETSDLPDIDMKCEALAPLLEKKLKAHFHCHRADDIFTALRIAKEFDLDCVLVHCTEGHLVADELGEEKASAIIGPIICDPCKPELANITPKNSGILAANGVKVAICTDHAETPVEYLPITVGIAVKNGLDFNNALEAVTINAAEIVGIDDLCGSVESGKRADLVMFDSNPFEVMSSPKLVVVGGKVCFGE